MAPNTYNDVIVRLNSLETNAKTRQRIINGEDREVVIPQMQEWVRQCGYELTDLDRLNAIHVAGSKGKGSTSVFISTILSQYLDSNDELHEGAGIKRLGLYTSPHLRTIRERIRLWTSAEEPFSHTVISEKLFGQRFSQVWELLEMERKEVTDRPSFFKSLTLAAFHTFLQEGVNTAIIEVGIGGQYDCTNVLHQPSVCAITSLGLDHTDLLGESIGEIAWHKSGIFKEGCPAYTVEQLPEAMLMIKKRAAEKNVPLQIVRSHPDIETAPLGLAGDFQKINANLAVAVAAEHLRTMGYLEIPCDIMAGPLPLKFLNGLKDASWPGRCESRQQNGITWCLDGAHTVESIKLVGDWFARTIQQEMSATRILIFNQETRDAVQLLLHLRRMIFNSAGMNCDWKPFSHIIFCTNIAWSKDIDFDAESKAMMDTGKPVGDLDVQHNLASSWQDIPGESHTDVIVVRSVQEAVDFVLHHGSKAGTSGVFTLVTGSLHLVGSASQVLDTCL
ncbi:folylpolyglutamate synthase-1 [Coleophoma cylindrospora]|uniref:Folylpolyglutamate synthase n=1 Tax=Coleophoma cylindrospora TaxID=1849047 RepID=A0A3D8S6Q2_9HELO|nr:folylpolyglutamate synthase-1 [Coleophoma cylindrospora]